MKIILLQDVKSLGKKNDMVEINDGYARNYVLPKKIGIEASAKNMNELKLKLAHEEKRRQEIKEEAKAFGEQLKSKEVELKIKAGQDGRVFGSVSTKEIANAAKEQLGYDLDKKKMQLKEPIKNVGTYSVPIKLHPEVTVDLTVKVSAQ